MRRVTREARSQATDAVNLNVQKILLFSFRSTLIIFPPPSFHYYSPKISPQDRLLFSVADPDTI